MKHFLILAGMMIVLAMLVACTAPATPASTTVPAQLIAVAAQPAAAPTQPARVAAPLAAPTRVTAAPTPLPPPTPVLTVATTLDGLTTLPHRIRWEAITPVNTLQTNFYIDGQHVWKFRANNSWLIAGAQADYGDDAQYLVTTFLTPGEHRFEVRMVPDPNPDTVFGPALTVNAKVLDSVVTATVAAAPAPPDGLANTAWTRTLTAADLAKASSPGPHGHPGDHIGLSIDSVGWMFHDAAGKGLLFDVDYPAKGQVVLRASIEKPPFPNNTGGAFCDEPDPDAQWTYTLSNGGQTLTLHPVASDPCGNRVGMLAGAWTSQAK